MSLNALRIRWLPPKSAGARTRFFALHHGLPAASGDRKKPDIAVVWASMPGTAYSAVYAFTVLENPACAGEPGYWVGRFMSGNARNEGSKQPSSATSSATPSVPSRSHRTGARPPPSLFAQQMYESRDFSAMPILADALQDAGCDNADILDHCRGPGPHVRGCWVVDLVLGKE